MIRTVLRLASAVLALAAAAGSAHGDPRGIALDAPRIAHLAGLERLDGRALEARRLAGRPVLVAFFASWCEPCGTTFENLRLLQLSYAADGLTIVAVDLFEDRGQPDEDTARQERFLGRHQPVFSVVEGTEETVRLFGGDIRVPAVRAFDREGRPVGRLDPAPDGTGPTLESLRGAVRDALGFSAAEARPPVFGPILAYRKHQPQMPAYSLGFVPRAHREGMRGR